MAEKKILKAEDLDRHDLTPEEAEKMIKKDGEPYIRKEHDDTVVLYYEKKKTGSK